MINWLKTQNWYWSLYYEYGLQFSWLPQPKLRIWHVLLLDEMESPFPRAGWKQEVSRIQL